MAKACLLVLMQPSPPFEEEFNAWYDTDHVPERLAVPGFLSARRYVCRDGWPAYLALYDLAERAVLESPAYRRVAGANYTPWTRRVLMRVHAERHVLLRRDEGDGLTTDCPRLLLVRFAAAGAEAGPALGESLAILRRHCPEVAAARLMERDDAPGSYYALIESRSPLTAVTAGSFARYGAHIDLWNVYARR